MKNFFTFGLPDFLLESLDRMKITEPTPIQEAAIPIAMEGKDVLASAQTGTGKTIAYMLPIVANLINGQGAALIMTPTRELAIQVKATLDQLLGRKPAFESAVLIGGEAIVKQFGQLRRFPRVVIGTPGRIIDHINRKTLVLKDTKFLVLDEMDRMLDMGFTDQLEEINWHLPKERQTLMFSATMPSNIIKISQKYLRDPQRVTIGSTTEPIAKIQQDTVHLSHAEKFSKLLQEIDSREGSIIVFVKTKRGADNLSDKLQDKGHSADAIHGDLQQRKRERVIQSFRNKRNRIMVATDVAARGLDVPHIEHVINYDLPQCPEDYIHRIGRTGRAGAEGRALSFITSDESGKWRMIQRLINPGAPVERGPDEGRGRRDSRGRSDRFDRGDRSGGRPEAKRRFGDKPFGDKPFAGKSSSGKPFGDKPFGARSSSGKPFGDKPFGGKSSSGKSFGDKPFGSKSSSGKSFGSRDGASFSRDGARRSSGPRKSGSF